MRTSGLMTCEKSNSTANSSDRKLLDNSKGLNVNSLLIKYYLPLAHSYKVIKLLKFKSAMNLQCFSNARRNRERRFRNRMRSLDRNTANSLQC